ncbi:MAG: ribonuclease P protein component 4 [Candidatus Methanomethylophilaceae archaeon]
MSRRSITSKQASEIGRRRISVLTGLAEEAAREGNTDRAKRYVELARRIGMKTRTGIPKEFRYCEECLVPLIPEISCRVRLNQGKITVTCSECGTLKRFPYLREQKDDRERSQKRTDETRQ